MLYLECAYRYADVSALMRLVAIEVADNLLSAIRCACRLSAMWLTILREKK